jgi:hypothetical protein
MDISLLEALYITLIAFLAVTGTLLSIVLFKLIRILNTLEEMVQIYLQIKEIFQIYSQIPVMLIEFVKNMIL